MAGIGIEPNVSNGGFFTGSDKAIEKLLAAGIEIKNREKDGQIAAAEQQREIREIDGVKYVWNSHRDKWELFDRGTPLDPPHPKCLEFFDLDGIIAYINCNTEGLIPQDGTKLMMIVRDESSVVLMSLPTPFNKERYPIATVVAHVPHIKFGAYMDIDTFNTMLLSTFVETDARKTLFSVVKAMTKEQSASVTDDGVGQVVTVKQGVSMAQNVTFQNPVPLKPMRTFTEIDQPESNFTLRVNEDAEVALFESDGGFWKNMAVARIAEYLRTKITHPGVVVIA